MNQKMTYLMDKKAYHMNKLAYHEQNGNAAGAEYQRKKIEYIDTRIMSLGGNDNE